MQRTILAFAASTVSIVAQTLGPYVTPAHLQPNGFPWGNSFSQVRWQDTPSTGDIRSYDWTISRGTINTDGVTVPALLVNNQFPGPMIEANWGDTIEVMLYNNISDEGTAIHWHGLYQHGSQWNDGIPAIDQCPIAPGSSFKYTFKADQYGTSWWHSHYDGQWASGLVGPMIIHGPQTEPYDIDLGPLLISDWHHQYYQHYIDISSGVPFQAAEYDNNLINGKTAFQYNCATGPNCTDYSSIHQFKFTPGKVHRLRLINTGSDGIWRFAIDGHKMKVISHDFTPVEPYETDLVVMGIGQRTDILVYGSGTADSSWFIRADQHTLAAYCGAGNQTHSWASIYYPEADTSKAPTSQPGSAISDYNIDFCRNQPLTQTVPLFPKDRSPPSYAMNYDITVAKNETGNTLFYVNDVSFRANYDNPILLLSKLGNTSYPDDPQWNVYNFGTNSSVRVFINNTTPFAHPIHLHGHNFWVLAEGLGDWDGKIVDNPMRRDVEIVQPGTRNGSAFGYVVLEWEQDNPGVWPFHCHIAWHSSLGLFTSVIEHPEAIKEFDIPPAAAQTCREWWNWSGNHMVDQIDSGL